jgi:predicted outer membrane lipoprotein
LIVLLFLLIWRKTRRYASMMFLLGISFGVLVFGWCQTLKAYFTTDLQDYSERFTGASGVLLICIFWIVGALLLSLVKSRVAKRQVPPIIG